MTGSQIARSMSTALLLAPLMGAASFAQGSCLDCHTVRNEELTARDGLHGTHLEEYRDSAHYRAGVGCQACHGGDPGAFDEWRAHRGILNSAHPSSRTYVTTLPRTCGGCHAPIYAAFRRHSHWRLLEEGDRRAPVCTTCHVDMTSQLLVPAPNRCTACHSEEPDAIAKPLAGRGRELLSRMQDVGELRRKAARKVRKVRDDERRHDLEAAYHAADSRWEQAIEVGHGFQWDEWEAMIEETRGGFEALLVAIERRR